MLLFSISVYLRQFGNDADLGRVRLSLKGLGSSHHATLPLEDATGQGSPVEGELEVELFVQSVAPPLPPPGPTSR